MKVLFVSPSVPYPVNRSLQRRMYNLIKALSRTNEISLFSISAHDDEAAYKEEFEFCSFVDFERAAMNPWISFLKQIFEPNVDSVAHWGFEKVEKRLAEILASYSFDVIHCQDICMTQFFMNFDLSVPIVTDRYRVDLDFQIERHKKLGVFLSRLVKNFEAKKLSAYENEILEKFKYQIVSCRRDYGFLLERFGSDDNFTVIPNGYDEYTYSKANRIKDASRQNLNLVFASLDDSQMDKDSLIWFIENVYEQVLAIAGNISFSVAGVRADEQLLGTARKYKNIVFANKQDDIADSICGCDVYVCPCIGEGGNNKNLINALAMGVPVVSTTAGFGDLELVPNEHLLAADDPQAFANSIEMLLSNKELAEKIGGNGSEFARQNLTWNKSAELLNSFYDYCLQDFNRHNYEVEIIESDD